MEVAVDAFLNHQMGFGDIYPLLDAIMNKAEYMEPEAIDAVVALDKYARLLSDDFKQSRMSA